MYQPHDGDRVTVTRHHPTGRTSTWTGTLSAVSPTGFYLTGVDSRGHRYDGYLSSAAVLARYGATQTITPA
ncbi:hypothetical protein ACH4ZX_03840 [Streptomyces sp. NPDC020490]|uniref:hypothetical protein n=1 Tax=Streptomyces sp. NPDC020490 TaxID=3365078 RepID=UPI00378F919D